MRPVGCCPVVVCVRCEEFLTLQGTLCRSRFTAVLLQPSHWRPDTWHSFLTGFLFLNLPAVVAEEVPESSHGSSAQFSLLGSDEAVAHDGHAHLYRRRASSPHFHTQNICRRYRRFHHVSQCTTDVQARMFSVWLCNLDHESVLFRLWTQSYVHAVQCDHTNANKACQNWKDLDCVLTASNWASYVLAAHALAKKCEVSLRSVFPTAGFPTATLAIVVLYYTFVQVGMEAHRRRHARLDKTTKLKTTWRQPIQIAVLLMWGVLVFEVFHCSSPIPLNAGSDQEASGEAHHDSFWSWCVIFLRMSTQLSIVPNDIPRTSLSSVNNCAISRSLGNTCIFHQIGVEMFSATLRVIDQTSSFGLRASAQCVLRPGKNQSLCTFRTNMGSLQV